MIHLCRLYSFVCSFLHSFIHSFVQSFLFHYFTAHYTRPFIAFLHVTAVDAAKNCYCQQNDVTVIPSNNKSEVCIHAINRANDATEAWNPAADISLRPHTSYILNEFDRRSWGHLPSTGRSTASHTIVRSLGFIFRDVRLSKNTSFP